MGGAGVACDNSDPRQPGPGHAPQESLVVSDRKPPDFRGQIRNKEARSARRITLLKVRWRLRDKLRH